MRRPVLALCDTYQGLDKTCAFLAEARATYPARPVAVWVWLRPDYGSAEAAVYKAWLASVVGWSVWIHPSGEIDEHGQGWTDFAAVATSAGSITPDTGRVIARALGECAVDYSSSLLERAPVRALIDGIPPETDVVLHINGYNKALGRATAKVARTRDGRVFVGFKSLHDAGAGLTTILNAPRVTAIKSPQRGERSVHRIRAVLQGVKQRLGVEVPDQAVDAWLAFNRAHRDVLVSNRGLHSERIALIGYPLLFPAWKRLVYESEEYKAYCQERRAREVVVFTRGETPGRPPQDNVLPHTTLTQILDDILSALPAYGGPTRIRIKPHPIQDIAFLKGIVGGRENVMIAYEPPSLLAATSDIAISTYSSTVIDALVFGIPSIEYYIENRFFRQKHPMGSPFPGMGVLRANNGVEFRAALDRIGSPDYELPDIAQALGHETDLSILGA